MGAKRGRGSKDLFWFLYNLVSSMTGANGSDHELGACKCGKSEKWVSCIFHTFLKICQDLSFEASHLGVYQFYENVERFIL